jgi:hypothetical protein
MLTSNTQMGSNVAYPGSRFTIEYAVLKDGSVPGREFLAGQDSRWRAQLLRLYELMGDSGSIRNPEKFSKLEGDFFEFKAYQIRMIFYFRRDRRVVITHGCIKKRDRINREELRRAARIKEEYEAMLNEVRS